MKGATLVMRSARSRGPADLIAVFPGRQEIWLVQVKAEDVRSARDLAERFKDLKSLEGDYRLMPVLFAKLRGQYQFLFL